MRTTLALLGIAALTVAVTVPDTSATLPGLLLGTTFILDEINRPILLATGCAWLIAAFMSTEELSTRVKLALVGVVTGNAVVVASGDYASLYCGFAVMSLSAYGLFGGQTDSRQAGFVYIVFAITAELLLFAAMLMLAAQDAEPASATPLWVTLGVLAGFGVKAGLIPVHGTLPLTYRHVPIIGGIVLAGAAINAGILGWLRWFADVSLVDGETIGMVVSALGVAGYLYSVLLALSQQNPRAILGYSSVSQVSLMVIVLGAGLAATDSRMSWFAGIAVMALFHAVAKTGLFAASAGYPANQSGAAVWWLNVILATVSLAGVTFTAGYLAKSTVTQAASEHIPFITSWLWLSGFFTTLVIAWFVARVRSNKSVQYSSTQHAGLALIALSFVGLGLWAAPSQSHTAIDMLFSVAPILFAALIARWSGARISSHDKVTTGDITVTVVTATTRCARWLFACLNNLSLNPLKKGELHK